MTCHRSFFLSSHPYIYEYNNIVCCDSMLRGRLHLVDYKMDRSLMYGDERIMSIG